MLGNWKIAGMVGLVLAAVACGGTTAPAQAKDPSEAPKTDTESGSTPSTGTPSESKSEGSDSPKPASSGAGASKPSGSQPISDAPFEGGGDSTPDKGKTKK